MASANANLHKAKDAKNDEFYTQLTDVAKELMQMICGFIIRALSTGRR